LRGGYTIYFETGLRSRSRMFLGESESDFFVQLRLRKSNWIIFDITLLSWEFLLKWYSFLWTFCWNGEFVLCPTISIEY